MAKSKSKQKAAWKAAAKVVAADHAKLQKATLDAAGLRAPWRWHRGNVTALGFFSTAGGREVVIQWNEGGTSRRQGGITDKQWEIFRLAYEGSGKISVLSDKPGSAWKFDYRFLEAPRN